MRIKKVLTFRASSIGDGLMAKYLLENVHAQFPEARCGIVVAGRGAMLRDLFAAYPWLEVIEANRRDLRSLWRLWRDWHGSDLVTIQVAGKNGGAFGLASKMAARLLARRGGLIGFFDAYRFNHILYDRLLPVRTGVSVIEYERDVLRAAGLEVKFERPDFTYIPDLGALERFGLAAGRYVVVQMFAGNDGRGINSDNRHALLGVLRAKFPEEIILVISGGVGDRLAAEAAAKDIPSVIVIAGMATLQELSNIIAKSRGVISLDTGVGHLVAHLQRPLVILRTCMGAPWWVETQYGLDIPAASFSREDLCVAGHRAMNFPICLNKIDMSEVASRAAKVFEQN